MMFQFTAASPSGTLVGGTKQNTIETNDSVTSDTTLRFKGIILRAEIGLRWMRVPQRPPADRSWRQVRAPADLDRIFRLLLPSYGSTLPGSHKLPSRLCKGMVQLKNAPPCLRPMHIDRFDDRRQWCRLALSPYAADQHSYQQKRTKSTMFTLSTEEKKLRLNSVTRWSQKTQLSNTFAFVPP